MGGCLGPCSSDGVEGPPFEFDVGCDPIATAALLALPLPISLVTVDVTVHTHLTDDDRAAVRAAGPLGRALDVLSDNFLTLLAGFLPEASSKVRLHDPVTVATLVEPSIATLETRRLSAHGPAGECRTVETSHGRPVECLTTVDGERLAALVVEAVTGS